jgi:hypothetical protein
MSYFILPLFEPYINLFPICYFIPLLILWLAKTLNQGTTIGYTTTHTHKLEQNFLKPKLHISKEKRIIMNFLIPSWVFPLLANLLFILDKTFSYLDAPYLLLFLPSLIISLPTLNHNNIHILLKLLELYYVPHPLSLF